MVVQNFEVRGKCIGQPYCQPGERPFPIPKGLVLLALDCVEHSADLYQPLLLNQIVFFIFWIQKLMTVKMQHGHSTVELMGVGAMHTLDIIESPTDSLNWFFYSLLFYCNVLIELCVLDFQESEISSMICCVSCTFLACLQEKCATARSRVYAVLIPAIWIWL